MTLTRLIYTLPHILISCYGYWNIALFNLVWLYVTSNPDATSVLKRISLTRSVGVFSDQLF